MLGRIRGVVITLLLIEIVIFGAMVLTSPSMSSITALLKHYFIKNEVRLFQLVEHVEEIKILELATMKMEFTGTYDQKTINKVKWLGPIGIRTIDFQTSGYVKAGINLEKLPKNFIRFYSSEEDQKIYISLPKPEILDVNLEVDKTKITDVDRTLFATLGNEQRYINKLSTIKNRWKLRAIKRGILEKAKEKPREMITELITKLGDRKAEEISVVFEDEIEVKKLREMKRPEM